MDCHNIDTLLMKYMDNALDESETDSLKAHLSECSGCAEDFSMYEDILTGFSEMELISAPEGFEDRVMSRVMALPSLADSAVEKMMCVIWGGVSILFGLIALNHNSLLEFMYSRPALDDIAAAISSAREFFFVLANGAAFVANQIMTATMLYASSVQYTLLAILAVLIAAQFALYGRAEKSRA